MEPIAEVKHETIRYEPAKIVVDVVIREKVACNFSSALNLIHFLRQNRSTWLPMIQDKKRAAAAG